jgi:DDE family transposase
VKIHRCASGGKGGAETQAIGVTTPGNTADCVVAETCVSLIPGITKLVADKGYDTDAFRSFLKEHGIETVIPGNPIARSAFGTTRKPTRAATSSSAVFAASKIGDASPPATTNSRETFSPRCVLSLCWPTGFDLIESRP